MANYEDQNSSEYKDMNQETPAAAPETRKELLRDDLPDQRDLRSLNALLLRLPGRYHLRRRGGLLRHHL